MGCKCFACGKRYKIDLMIPDELWNKITPMFSRQILLCGSCIMEKLERLNKYDYWFLTKQQEKG